MGLGFTVGVGVKVGVGVGEVVGVAPGVVDAVGVELAPLVGEELGAPEGGGFAAVMPVEDEGDWLGVADWLAAAVGAEVGAKVGAELGEALGAGDVVNCWDKAAAVGTRVVSIGCQLPDGSR